MSQKQKFTIDDAFEPEDDDAIRTYGSTTESTPLKPKRGLSPDESIVVRVEDSKERGMLSRLKLPDDALSKDSDSLIQGEMGHSKYNTKEGWWTHPKVKENWRVMLAAFGLLLGGVGLIITGIIVQLNPKIGVQGFVFFIAGAICFIPGAYHVVYVYCAVKGKRGYDFYNLPLFN
ncbi:transmembrane protein 134-like [Ornithodoros turicata]